MKDFLLIIIFFRIQNPLGEKKSLYELAKRIDITDINYIKPEAFFQNKSACETHNDLSLTNNNFSNKHIFVVTEIHPELLIMEKDKTKSYIIWEVKYDGTIKDLSYTNLGRGPFFEKIRNRKD